VWDLKCVFTMLNGSLLQLFHCQIVFIVLPIYQKNKYLSGVYMLTSKLTTNVPIDSN